MHVVLILYVPDQQLTKKKTQLEINYDRTEIGESCDTNKKFFFFIFEIKIELQLSIDVWIPKTKIEN